MDKFNNVSSASFPPLKKARDLEEGSIHTVKELRFTNTKFGEAIVAVLQPSAGGEEFSIFLPKRFVRSFDGVDLTEFNDGTYTLTFSDVQERSPTIVMARNN